MEGDNKPEGAMALALLHLNKLPNGCPAPAWCDRLGRCYAKWLMRPECPDAEARHPEPGLRDTTPGTSSPGTPSLPAGGPDPP